MDVVDGDGANILHYAAKSANAPVRKIQMLLSNEFNINAQDRKRMTPLHYAYRFRNHPAIEELVRLGADQNIQDENGRTPAQVEAIDSGR